MTDESIATDEAQVIEEDEVAEEEVPQPASQPKKVTSVDKILAKKNEAERRATAAEARLKELEPLAQKATEMEEQLAQAALDKDVQNEKNAYYAGNPKAKELESVIDALVVDKGLSYDDAFKLAAADNKPELLLEAAALNKSAGGYTLTGVARENANVNVPETIEDLNKMEDGKVLEWMENQAKAERIGQGKLR